MFHVEHHTILADLLNGVLMRRMRSGETNALSPSSIIHRERSYCYRCVVLCADHSVSTRRTQAGKQRWWGAVGSSKARLNRGHGIEPVLDREASVLALVRILEQ
jgi:hypothetical protein